jgi:hypothetical protein
MISSQVFGENVGKNLKGNKKERKKERKIKTYFFMDRKNT